MGKYRQYVDYLKLKTKEIEIQLGRPLIDIEKLRLIYIDLGKKLDFDLNYTFGNHAQRNMIFNKSLGEKSYDEMLETHTAICKGMSYIFMDIARQLDIQGVVVDRTDYHNHVKNRYFVDGKSYIIDLEEDLEYIQSKSKTRYFCVPEKHSDIEPLISEEELRDIDENVVKYIPEGFYFEDVVWLLQKACIGCTSLEEKLEFVLANVNSYSDMSKVKYRERAKFHESLVSSIFTKKEMNKIKRLDARFVEGDKNVYRSLYVLSGNEPVCFIQNLDTNRYDRISLDDLARMKLNGMDINQNIHGLNKKVLKLQNGEGR